MWRLSVLALIATTAAQLPSLGWCPDYQQPLANFNMQRFLGTWYEAERYFTLREIVNRCVATTYESTPEGRTTVSNEITNSITGTKRRLDGYVQMTGREGEGRILVRYSALPMPYETSYEILDTDYDNWAVMFSCSGIGPVHIQNAWVLTRERLAPPPVMQAAYGVLDKFNIYRTFFVKTPQEDCNILPNPFSADGKEENVESNAEVVPGAVDKVNELSVEKQVKPEVLVEEASKPMQVPELIMSEFSEKKEEKMEKPEKCPEKAEKPEIEMPKPQMPMESYKEKESMETKS